MLKLFKLILVLISFGGGNLLFGQSTTSSRTITPSDLEKAGTSIPPSSIGEPVGTVVLYPARWVAVTETTPAYGIVEGSIMPVDPNGWPINFRVLLPALWSAKWNEGASFLEPFFLALFFLFYG